MNECLLLDSYIISLQYDLNSELINESKIIDFAKKIFKLDTPKEYESVLKKIQSYSKKKDISGLKRMSNSIYLPKSVNEDLLYKLTSKKVDKFHEIYTYAESKVKDLPNLPEKMKPITIYLMALFSSLKSSSIEANKKAIDLKIKTFEKQDKTQIVLGLIVSVVSIALIGSQTFTAVTTVGITSMAIFKMIFLLLAIFMLLKKFA